MSTEAIFQAVFNRAKAATWSAMSVGGSTGFKFSSRKWQFLDETPPEQMPALFQRQFNLTPRQQANQPVNDLIRVELSVYVATLAQQNGDLIPSTQLNTVFDALRVALAPQPGDRDPLRNTLGGLVYECKINGVVEYFEGDLGDRGVLVIPVEITVPF